MKSIRMRIMVYMCLQVLVSLVIVASVTAYFNFSTARGVLEQALRETAIIAADRVTHQINSYLFVAQELGMNSDVSDPELSVEAKRKIIDGCVTNYKDITRGNILGMDGVSIFDGTNFSDRDYFKKAMKGESNISDPVVSRITGIVSMIIAAPIYEGGDPSADVVGVVYLVPTEDFLNEIVSSIKMSNNAGAQIISGKGTLIAHPDRELAKAMSNNSELAKTDPTYESVSKLEQEQIKGGRGFGIYTFKGVEKFLGWAPIEGTAGWSLGVNAPIEDFMKYTYTSVFSVIALLVVFLILAFILAAYVAGQIGTPIKFLSGFIQKLALTGEMNFDKGTLDTCRQYSRAQDEVGLIASSVTEMVDMLGEKVEVINSVAQGDLTCEVTLRSNDDTIGAALGKMVNDLNHMFSEIRNASTAVATGSLQVSNGAQALAQGSSEQAASVEELSATIAGVADVTNNNAQLAEEAAGLSSNIKVSAETGSSQMEQMMQAVKEINEASTSIGKVIKVIDDIAFQTNILALNAAVEAARAGQHGKGFAVVAEEVRNLAAKSAEAAKDTSSLIENSIEKAKLGHQIATETATSLEGIVNGINMSTEIVAKIAKFSDEQARSIAEINKGIDQVAIVVQQNTSTAEKSAATSAGMSDQSHLLQDLIARFKTKSEQFGGAQSHGHEPLQLQLPEKNTVNDKY